MPERADEATMLSDDIRDDTRTALLAKAAALWADDGPGGEGAQGGGFRMLIELDGASVASEYAPQDDGKCSYGIWSGNVSTTPGTHTFKFFDKWLYGNSPHQGPWSVNYTVTTP